MRKENNLVTENGLNLQLKEFRLRIIHDVRVMMHEMYLSAMENMKHYHQEETNRYVGALTEHYQSNLQGNGDKIRAVDEKVDRIIKLNNLENYV